MAHKGFKYNKKKKPRGEVNRPLISVMAIKRKQCRITQQELAELVGITQAEISMVERGHNKPREEVLMKIAQTLDVPAEELQLDYSEWLLAK